MSLSRSACRRPKSRVPLSERRGHIVFASHASRSPRATSLIAWEEGARARARGVCGLSIIHGPLPVPETRPRLLALGSIRYIRGPISFPRYATTKRARRGSTPSLPPLPPCLSAAASRPPCYPLTFMGNRASVSTRGMVDSRSPESPPSNGIPTARGFRRWLTIRSGNVDSRLHLSDCGYLISHGARRRI